MYKVKNREELDQIIDNICNEDHSIKLQYLDVSNITDMSYLFMITLTLPS